MNGWEIAILVFVCVAFMAAVGVIIYNKVKGKSCCGDCSGCNGCAANKKNAERDRCCMHCMKNANREKDAQFINNSN